MLPQVTVNVRVADRDAASSRSEVRAALAEAEQTLGGRGRILLRRSGTEPVLRVMVEAPTRTECQTLADRVAETILRSESGK